MLGRHVLWCMDQALAESKQVTNKQRKRRLSLICLRSLTLTARPAIFVHFKLWRKISSSIHLYRTAAILD